MSSETRRVGTLIDRFNAGLLSDHERHLLVRLLEEIADDTGQPEAMRAVAALTLAFIYSRLAYA
jgi:hypothetical protein